MTTEELMKMRERVKAEMDKSLEKALSSATDEDVKKYENIVRQIEDLDARIEMSEAKGNVPAKKVTELTESQKWTMKFVEAVSSSGNFSGAMPREMAAEVVKKLQQIAGIKNFCRTMTTASDIAITVETGLPTVAYVGEGGQIGETAPSTAPVILNAYKLACIVKINRELVKDVAFSIQSYVEDAIARSIAAKIESEILFGAGATSNNIEGVTGKSGIHSKAAASATTVTWTEVKNALSALGPYKQGCTVVVGQEIADAIHDFKDGSGNYLFPQNEELTRIKGHPVVISDAMPTPGANKVLLVAGNFNYYQIGYRENVDISVLSELYAANDQIGVKATTRLDGKVLQPEAFSIITGKA